MLDTILSYYRRIDAGDLAVLAEVFDIDASYNRAGQQLRGLESIEKFYTENRKIRGRHRIDDSLESGDLIVVEGRFEGRGADGSPREVAFADFWRHESGRVVSRSSYLASGSDYVTE